MVITNIAQWKHEASLTLKDLKKYYTESDILTPHFLEILLSLIMKLIYTCKSKRFIPIKKITTFLIRYFYRYCTVIAFKASRPRSRQNTLLTKLLFHTRFSPAKLKPYSKSLEQMNNANRWVKIPKTGVCYVPQEIYRNTYLILVQLCVNSPRMF